MIIKDNVPIAQLTTFQNVGEVKRVFVAETVEDIRQFLTQTTQPFFILGKGSNTLINPDGAIQTFLQLHHNLTPVEINGTLLKVSAGTPVNKLMTLLQDNELSGLEFAAGVPASVGGMIAMNFGCWGQEVSQLVTRVRVMKETGEDQWLSNEELEFGYRKSIIQTQPWVVIEAEFQCKKADKEKIKDSILANIKLRNEKQPLRDRTFGSVFKNPKGNFAAAIIEHLGYKGAPNGTVYMSLKHANFMVNPDHGTFKDALGLMDLIRQDAWIKTGFYLETEVKIVS